MSIILALTLASAAVADTRWQNIAHTPGFPGWRTAIRDHVQRSARHRINHLCVVVGRDATPGGSATAYVYWPEQRRIELLSQANDPVLSQELFAQGPIYLDRDIIGEHGQTGLSPTSVTRAWVHQLVSRCRATGTRLTIVKKR